jgi:hypothetical protein
MLTSPAGFHATAWQPSKLRLATIMEDSEHPDEMTLTECQSW